MGLTIFLRSQPRPLIFAFGLALVLFLGLADYVTGPELFFLEFYLVPVFLVAWFVGESAALFLTVASAISWFVDEVVGRSPYSKPAIPYWNVAFKFLVFAFFIHLVTIFKDALEREKQAEQERIHREIEIARQVQETLLPQTLPPMNTIDYCGICRPAFGIGGDYYDFLPIDCGRLGIAVGDVSGKGISSALLMASLQGILHSKTATDGVHASRLIGELNRLMISSGGGSRYVTFFYGIYDDAAKCLKYVNAGHNPPLVFRRNSTNGVTKLMPNGTVIGLIPDAVYTESQIQLQSGDIFVCYTDGISEAMDVKDQEFTEDRLIEVIQKHCSQSANQLRDTILKELEVFCGKASQRDDQTLVILRVL